MSPPQSPPSLHGTEASLETIAGPLSKHIHDLLATEGEALAKVGGVITAVVCKSQLDLCSIQQSDLRLTRL